MRKLAVPVVAAALVLLPACAEDDVAVDDDALVAGEEDVDLVDPLLDFETLDVDGDSSLDADEVAEWVDDSGLFESWDADADSELDSDELEGNAFELWDIDGDGTVSEPEWEEATELFYPDDVDVTVFGDADGDGDSELDADEFAESIDLSEVGEAWSSETFDEATFREPYFELYDADDDGAVTSEEWDTGVRALGTPRE